MPVQYTTILEEHRAVREKAGLFDVSHMGEFHVFGPDAAAFLDRLLVNAISQAAPGKAVYSPMCNGDGGVVDDLIVYRADTDSFLVCVNASNIEKDFGWFLKQGERWKFDVEVEDHSDAYALLALQGPEAAAILDAAGFSAACGLKRFRHDRFPFSGRKIRICRTGYTGEDGFEIYCDAALASPLAETLMEAGAPRGLQLCGLGARDSLRLEAGLPLYGHELNDSTSPLEAGLEWTVKFEKPDFIGKDAMSEQKRLGVPRKTVFFRLEGRRIARQGASVADADGATVGAVLSGSHSPMTGGPIGSAIIDAGATAPLYADLRRSKAALEVRRAPLHQ